MEENITSELNELDPLSQLVGGVIEAIAEDDHPEVMEEFGEPYVGLIIRTMTGERFQIIAMRDAEGNGPGFLDIQNLRIVGD